MRTFEFGKKKDRLFWTADRRGVLVTLRGGGHGKRGWIRSHEFENAKTARAEHDRLVAAKLAEGYVETTPAAPAPMRAALEAALVAGPDDLAAHMAYADFLTEQGDPRGEFIQTQLALEREGLPAEDRKQLQKREAALLKKHSAEWLGKLGPHLADEFFPFPTVEYRFARGWIDQLTLHCLTPDLAYDVATEPALRLVRQFAVASEIRWASDAERYGAVIDGDDSPEPDPPEDWEDWPGPGDFLAESSVLGNVRVLHLGTTDGWDANESGPITYNSADDLYHAGSKTWKLIETMKRLEELHLVANTFGIRDLFRSKSLKHLRVLQVYLTDEYPLDALAANPAMKRLTHLALHPLALDDDGASPHLGAEELRSVLRSPHLKSLTHLRMHQSGVGDVGCKEIVKSGILKRLKFLDLARGCVTDVGAGALAGCPDARNLEVLDLTCNALTEAGAAALRSVVPGLRADDQHGPDDDAYLLRGRDGIAARGGREPMPLFGAHVSIAAGPWSWRRRRRTATTLTWTRSTSPSSARWCARSLLVRAGSVSDGQPARRSRFRLGPEERLPGRATGHWTAAPLVG